MMQHDKMRSIPRVHAYAASFGEDLSSELIQESTEEGDVVLDPFVGAGTAALESVLSNRNTIGIDVDPIACRISRTLTSRFDTTYFVAATEYLKERLLSVEQLLVSEPQVYRDLGPESTFKVGSCVFRVPGEPAIAYWFDPSHMATLSVVREMVARELDPLVRQAFEVAISSCIIRKWPNTLSYAMDIDHSRPHRPRDPRAQPIEAQFALVNRVLDRVKDAILGIQENLAFVESSATILEGDSLHQLSRLDSDSVSFVLTSPPYLNAIDYPRAHKFSQWWLSPEKAPLRRSEYLGLRQSVANDTDGNRLSMDPRLSASLAPFRDMPIYRMISRYVIDLSEVIDQLYRVVKPRAKVVFVVGDNVIAGTVLPASTIIEQLLERSGFSSIGVTGRTIKHSRRRYPLGVNGFAGPMKEEYLITGVKPTR